MNAIDIIVANESEMPAAQRFYESLGYGGAAIAPSDFVVLAKAHDKIVGIGRLSQEQNLLWLRGMQVALQFQRQGIGTNILRRLDQEIGDRWCCCLPHDYLVSFYRQAGFEPVTTNLQVALHARLAGYRSRGLTVVAMVREARSLGAGQP
ncbi:MAG: GNAT family N-acetyltransferase [Proteobacteria bacterium]|nr:GNAT family N-acetyltransferase [Pseudomonadota bacterium]